MKKVFLWVVLAVFSGAGQAGLTSVGNGIYRSGEGESTLFWHLAQHDFINKTYAQQAGKAAYLSDQQLHGITNWHIADLQEVQQLLTIEYGQHNAEVAAILGLTSASDFNFRIDYVSSNPVYQGNHWNVKLVSRTKGWQATMGLSYWDNDRSPIVGTLIVGTPEPSTLFLAGLGALCMRRRSYNRRYKNGPEKL